MRGSSGCAPLDELVHVGAEGRVVRMLRQKCHMLRHILLLLLLESKIEEAGKDVSDWTSDDLSGRQVRVYKYIQTHLQINMKPNNECSRALRMSVMHR